MDDFYNSIFHINRPREGQTYTDLTLVEGYGVPGARIDLIIDGQLGGETFARDNGEWSFPLSLYLDEGAHMIKAAEWYGGRCRQECVNIRIVHLRPLLPASIAAPAFGETVAGETLVVQGMGTPGNTVEVTIDNTYSAEAIVMGGGWYSVEFTEAFDASQHIITCTQQTGGGQTSPEVRSIFYGT